MNYAPIALFCYNRPHHLKRTIEALAKNELARESDLHVFSDGPKPGQEENVEEVRNLLTKIEGFKSVKVHQSPTNTGLGESILRGVNGIFAEYDSIIVMEDDLLSSPYFLSFVNEGLQKYKGDPRVASIVGYNYPIKASNSTYFLNNADCLGWATWKDTWQFFEKDAKKLLDTLTERGLISRFNMDDSYPFSKLLSKVIEGKNSSWAIRWYASIFLQGKMTLYPEKSLIQHIGNDKGTNMSQSNFLDTELSMERTTMGDIPVVEDLFARKNLAKYFRKNVSYLGFIKNKISFFLSRLKRN